MSLINDALKKAQRQQTGGAAEPTPGDAPPSGHLPRIERREKPADFRSQMLILGGVSVGLLLALVVGGVFWWRGSHSMEPSPTNSIGKVPVPGLTEPKPVVSAPAKPEPVPQPTKIEPAPAATTATATTQFTLPLAPASSVPATSTPSSATTQAAVQLPPATPAVDAVKLPPAERPKPSQQMLKAIEGFRVTGIRSSGGDSKVLMNDRVFRVGDTVDHDLGLKLTGVAQGALTFEDDRGASYTRNF